MRRKEAEINGRTGASDTVILFVGLSALLASVTALAAAGPVSVRLTGMTMLINLMVVVGLYVFIGNSGVFSFGHLVFVQIGAYVGAMLMIPPSVKDAAYSDLYAVFRSLHIETIPATLIAGGIAMVVAVILAMPLMRLSGLAAALGTFVVLAIGNVVFKSWDAATGGSPGLSGIPSTNVWTVLAWSLVCVALACIFQQTAWCRRLRASREDPIAARSVGIRIGRERAVAFALSALIVGIAGALFGQAHQAIHPDAFFIDATFVALAMLVVGGMSSLTGAVVGTIVLSALAELLSRLQSGMDLGVMNVKLPVGSQQVGFALAMLAVLLVRPAGLTGGRELSTRSFRFVRQLRVGWASTR